VPFKNSLRLIAVRWLESVTCPPIEVRVSYIGCIQHAVGIDAAWRVGARRKAGRGQYELFAGA